MRHRTSVAPAALTALALLALGCGDGPQPMAPPPSSDAAPEPAPATAQQAAEQEGPGRSFAFFPPLRPASDPPGPFDASAAPVVEVCRLVDGTCAGEPVERFTPEGKGSERVRASEGKFVVNWHTKRSSLPDGTTVRVRVLVDGMKVGHLDVLLAGRGKRKGKGKGKKKGPAPAVGPVTVKNGRTVPVKFFVSEPPPALGIRVGRGVAGTPSTGARKVQWETVIEYDYTALEGFEDLVVVLDGEEVAASGSFTMDGDHLLLTSANRTVEMPPDGQELIESARSVLTAADKPAAFQAHLDRVGELVAEVGPEEARRRMEIVDFLAFDPAEDFEALVAADRALANHVFDVNVPSGGSGSPDAAAGASAPIRAAAASGSVASAVDTTAIFYVNGIFNSERDALDASLDLESIVTSAASAFSTEKQVTKLFYNRTYEEQTDAGRLKEAFCEADLARADDFLGFRQLLTRLATCLGITVQDLTENFDLIEAARQYLDVARLADFVPEEDARALADTLARRLEAGYNVVAVPHSQGNLMVQQAMEVVEAEHPDLDDPEPACVGVVSLGSPTSEGFGTRGDELEGVMIRHDLLDFLPERVGVPDLNGFRRLDTELSRRAEEVFEDAALASALLPDAGVLEDFARVRWGIRLHSASGSYLASPASRQRIRDGLVALDESLSRRCGVRLSIRPDSFAIGVGDLSGVRAFLTPPGGSLTRVDATWASLDPEIASVTQRGFIRGLRPGIAEIEARARGLADTARVEVIGGVGDLAGTWAGTWNNGLDFDEPFTEGPMTVVVSGDLEPSGSITMSRRGGVYSGELPATRPRGVEGARGGTMEIEVIRESFELKRQLAIFVGADFDDEDTSVNLRLVVKLRLDHGGTELVGRWHECIPDLCRFGQQTSAGNIVLERVD